VGLGLLGLGQLLLLALLGLGVAGAGGALEIDGDLLAAAALRPSGSWSGFFLSFAVVNDADSALATVVSFIPPAAPMTMPPRIALGEASAVEVVGALCVTLGAAALLLPFAARVYSGAMLRTGGSVRLLDAWRAIGG
jgi:ABC-2 type transport system permease protein